MKVTVIDEVPAIEVTVIKPTAGNHGHGRAPTPQPRAPATDETAPAASTDRHYSADMSGTHNLLEVRRASYRLS